MPHHTIPYRTILYSSNEKGGLARGELGNSSDIKLLFSENGCWWGVVELNFCIFAAPPFCYAPRPALQTRSARVPHRLRVCVKVCVCCSSVCTSLCLCVSLLLWMSMSVLLQYLHILHVLARIMTWCTRIVIHSSISHSVALCLRYTTIFRCILRTHTHHTRAAACACALTTIYYYCYTISTSCVIIKC